MAIMVCRNIQEFKEINCTHCAALHLSPRVATEHTSSSGFERKGSRKMLVKLVLLLLLVVHVIVPDSPNPSIPQPYPP